MRKVSGNPGGRPKVIAGIGAAVPADAREGVRLMAWEMWADEQPDETMAAATAFLIENNGYQCPENRPLTGHATAPPHGMGGFLK